MQEKVATRTVTLLQNHTEGDKRYYAGETVTLPEESALYLVSINAAVTPKTKSSEKS